jgi:ATP-dependent DNA helicase HFM1/MER3
VNQGRPQFGPCYYPLLSPIHSYKTDKDGNAIILCETDLEHKYKSLVQGKTTIESSLHRNLSEHLNSEIGLGTIKDTMSAKSWLCHSFLFQRIRKNPQHYSLGKEYHQTWEEKIGELVSENISKLQKTELVAYTDKDNVGLKSTEYGDIMSKACMIIVYPHLVSLLLDNLVLYPTINGIHPDS